jgi:hypothetical protein
MRGDWAAEFKAIGNVLTQTPAIVAVMHYSDRARSYALYPRFGGEPSMLRFSVINYVLRSVLPGARIHGPTGWAGRPRYGSGSL